jgi:hypothetical protein
MKFRAMPWVVLAASMTLVACAEEGAYIYRPVAHASTERLNGLVAARYAVPHKLAQGQVLIASSGVSETLVEGAQVRVLFVRMVVANDSSDAAWVLDTRRQYAILGGQKRTATFVNPYKRPVPEILVARGEKVTVDFYYRLEAGGDTIETVPKFDLEWTVQTNADAVTQVTSFGRDFVEPTYADTYYGPGYYGRYPAYYGPGHYGPGYGVYGGWGYGGYGSWYGGFGGSSWGPSRGYGGGGHFGGGRVRSYTPASPGVRP